MPTTIKVSTELRDRLKSQASAANLTLGEHLARLAELDDRRRRFEALGFAIRSTPPELMQSYRDESAAWDAVDA
ncbi:toxin-antitoxin system protein [Protaetiibacter larvae]|uniref:Toxin-antitoxin system protein n=1 Tax=Protaetiibacter larvae TaxID=2592654 RepID=A0A5C1YA63_9MICO|nr:toxin-antitoxin system protein [Protaetiibacter larvae]QEO09772.1 toxin-antitoxin system protein [Protaetiibacter larvae]